MIIFIENLFQGSPRRMEDEHRTGDQHRLRLLLLLDLRAVPQHHRTLQGPNLRWNEPRLELGGPGLKLEFYYISQKLKALQT